MEQIESDITSEKNMKTKFTHYMILCPPLYIILFTTFTTCPYDQVGSLAYKMVGDQISRYSNLTDNPHLPVKMITALIVISASEETISL